MLNLLRLSRLTGDSRYEQKAEELGRALSGLVERMPSSFTQLLIALDFALGPSYEVVIAGKTGAPDTKKMLEALNRRFLPNTVILFHPADEKSPAIEKLARFIRPQKTLDQKATAYVCHNRTCQKSSKRRFFFQAHS